MRLPALFALFGVMTLLPMISMAEGYSKKSFKPYLYSNTYYQNENVLNLTNGMNDVGSAGLTRRYNYVKATMALIGLEPNTAYTVWWVVANKPEFCANGPKNCSFIDAGNPDTELSIFYAIGFVTGSDGVANVDAYLPARGSKPVIGLDYEVEGGLEWGNGLRAAVQLVVRSHGPILPGRVSEQTSTFDGACEENVCAEVQYVAFEPVIFKK